jgi:hypothetical protein
MSIAMTRTRTTRRDLLILGGLALGAGALAMPAAAQPPIKTEPHPRIREAMQALRKAAEELRAAAHDFGGHRKEALEAVEVAHRQLRICLEYDRR